MGKQKIVKISKPVKQISSDSENENIDESILFEEKGLMHSTQLNPDLDEETQKQLIEQVKLQLGSVHDYIYTKTMQRINWNKIQIEGLTADKAKEEFEKIIKPVRKIKCLGEVILELERNPKKYMSDLPKQPPNAMFLYINENREKLIEKKGKLLLPELSKIAAEKFRKLPDHKRAIYEEKAKKLKDEYNEKMEIFYQNHPELKPVQAKKSEPKMDTPFNYFVHTKKQNSQIPLSREDLRNEWKILSPNDKAQFIKAVMEAPEDGRRKFISKDERKILDQANGMPERPLTAFTYFVKEYNQKHKGQTDLFKQAAAAWSNLDTKKKDRYIQMSNQSFETYKQRAEEYVSKLPLKEQANARKALQISAIKKKKTKSENDISKRKLEIEDDENLSDFPVKKVKTSDDDDEDDDDEMADDEELKPSQSIKQEIKVKEEKGSQKAMKVAIPEPEIPIQRVELYFMKHIYKGPQSGIKAAFDKLSAKKREKFEKIVDDNRRSFMAKLQTYIDSIDQHDQDKFKEKVQRTLKEQDELIACSKDNEESSSESADDDDDESNDESD
jgi:hypothetical protein